MKISTGLATVFIALLTGVSLAGAGEILDFDGRKVSEFSINKRFQVDTAPIPDMSKGYIAENDPTVLVGVVTPVEWVTLPGGKFLMGTDDFAPARPVHEVAIQAFEMSKTLVTIASSVNFDDYINKTVKVERNGILSLAGIVERIYHVDESFESMEKPGLFASSKQYDKYKKIRESLDLSTAEYLKWRKANVDPAPPSTNTGGAVAPAVSGQDHSSNPSTPNQSQHTHQPADDGGNGGAHSGSGSGEWHSQTQPHPGFNPDGSATLK